MVTRNFASSLMLSIALLFAPAAQATDTLICKYTKQADPDGLRNVDDFVLTFVIDYENGKAYMVGNLGSEEVTPIIDKDRMTFIEITGTGSAQITAVDKKGNSAHSRHTIIGTLMPSQYYGACVIK